MPFPRLLLLEAFTSTPLVEAPAFEKVDAVREFSSRRGRSSELDRPAAGTMETVVDARDREMDPTNTSSAHYPNIIPNRRTRLAVGYVADVLDANPNAYYRFADSGSSVVRDEMGHAPGAPTSVGFGSYGPIVGGWYAGFNGVADQIDIPDAAGWLRFTADFTVEAWVYKQTGANGGVFTCYKTGPLPAYQLFFDGNVPHFRYFDTSNVQHDCTGGSVTPGQWAHIVATFVVGSGMRLYVNGVQVATTLGALAGPRAGVGGVWLGRTESPGYYLDGILAEVAAYSYALPAATVAAHNSSGFSGSGGGYVAETFVDAHNISYVNDADAACAMPSTDAFKLFARAKLTAFGDRPVEPTSTRVTAILDYFGWPVSRRRVSNGVAVLAAEDLSELSVLDALLGIDATEMGRMFIDANGDFVFLSRDDMQTGVRQTTPRVVFGDDAAGGEIPYQDVTFEASETLIRNSVEITNPTLDPVFVSDASSIVDHGELAYQREVHVAASTAMTSIGERILQLNKDPVTRVLGLRVVANRPTATYPGGLYGLVLELRIGDRVTMRRRPPGGGLVEQDCYIERVAHSANAASQVWVAEFGLTYAPPPDAFGQWDVAQWDVDAWGF